MFYELTPLLSIVVAVMMVSIFALFIIVSATKNDDYNFIVLLVATIIGSSIYSLFLAVPFYGIVKVVDNISVSNYPDN